MNDDIDRDPLADALRASLAERAAEAPRGELLAERIIRGADRPPDALRRTPHRGWRTWALPVIAAGAVAGVVLAVAGIVNYRPEAVHRSSPAATQPKVLIGPASSAAAVRSTAPVPPIRAMTSPPVDTSTLHGVQILDLTFAGVDDGWALGSADCIHGSGRCTALLRTTDGRTWQSMPGAAFNVPVTGSAEACAEPCVDAIRFADDSVGYAYGANALFMTTDGGYTWRRQPGAAYFLETLDGNVIRVVHHGSCPGPCTVRVEAAAIGSSTWTASDVGAAGALPGTGLQFARGGSAAYLVFAGEGPNAPSRLYRSTDDGRTWTPGGDPCPGSNAVMSSAAIAGAPNGRVAVLCAPSLPADGPSFVATSDDAGASFALQPAPIPDDAVGGLVGDPATTLIASGGYHLARSTTGGRSWTPVAKVVGAMGFVGFESRDVGRVVTDRGRSIWTTRNAGRTWTEVSFG
jgi:hypothetical protein